MRIQAVVKYGDRHWDSTRDNMEEAYIRVCEHIKNTAPEFKDLAEFAQIEAIRGHLQNAVQMLKNEAFDVQFKGI